MIYQIESPSILKKDRPNSGSVAISSCDPHMDHAEQGNSGGRFWDGAVLVRIQYLHRSWLYMISSNEVLCNLGHTWC